MHVKHLFCFVSPRTLRRLQRKAQVCCCVGRTVLLTLCCDIGCSEVVMTPRVVHVLGSFFEFHVRNVAQAATLMMSSEVRFSAENARSNCYILAAQTARMLTNTNGA